MILPIERTVVMHFNFQNSCPLKTGMHLFSNPNLKYRLIVEHSVYGQFVCGTISITLVNYTLSGDFSMTFRPKKGVLANEGVWIYLHVFFLFLPFLQRGITFVTSSLFSWMTKLPK